MGAVGQARAIRQGRRPPQAIRCPAAWKRQRISERLAEATAGPYPFGGAELDYAGPSICTVSKDTSPFDTEAILAEADAAMYTNKRRRREQQER